MGENDTLRSVMSPNLEYGDGIKANGTAGDALEKAGQQMPPQTKPLLYNRIECQATPPTALIASALLHRIGEFCIFNSAWHLT
jgi:hypothetical protein